MTEPILSKTDRLAAWLKIFACLADGVLARGWSAALPGYTLAPDASLTQITRELRTAFDWLSAQSASHGIEGPVIISGWSAGGHLTAVMLDHPKVSAGLSISGVFELDPLRDSPHVNDKVKLTEVEIESLSPIRLPGVNKPLATITSLALPVPSAPMTRRLIRLAPGATPRNGVCWVESCGYGELPAMIGSSRDFHAYRSQSHLPGPLIPIVKTNHFTVLDELRSPNGSLTRAVVRLAEDSAR